VKANRQRGFTDWCDLPQGGCFRRTKPTLSREVLEPRKLAGFKVAQQSVSALSQRAASLKTALLSVVSVIVGK